MDFKKDYYKILEVDKNATKEAIRASYRRLAKMHHPDKNPGNPGTEEKFKLVNEAHEMLSNEITRHEYDEYKRVEEAWRANQKQESTTTTSANKRSYQRKKTLTKEQRIYIRGDIIIKYWADPADELNAGFQPEIKYKIHPTSSRVTIQETDIHPLQNIPSHYQKS